MATSHLSPTSAVVKRQYETFPYPLRDPSEEATRLLGTDLEDLMVVNHYCFRGRRDFRHGFRALVAGGGTGDSTIFLAQQLADTDASIVHLDFSERAIEVAVQRARQRGLEHKITWKCESLLDLPRLGLGTFDYINCCGVLHHLDDPAKGLAALTSVLNEDGAMGLMVYGRYGRAGVYQMQELMRLINTPEQSPQAMVENTRLVLNSLPETNWLKRAITSVPVREQMADTEIYDLFLHPQDRAFSVLELYDLLDRAGLHLVEFTKMHRALYDPQYSLRCEELQHRVEQLSRRQQQAVSELSWGTIIKHSCWVSPQTDTVADLHDPEMIPQFGLFAEQSGVRRSLLDAIKTSETNWKCSLPLSRPVVITVSLELNDVVRPLIGLIDGRRTIGDIVRTIAGSGNGSRTEDQIHNICRDTLGTLLAFDLVLLQHASVPTRPVIH